MTVADAVLKTGAMDLEESKWVSTVVMGMTCLMRITVFTGDRDWEVMTSASFYECNEAVGCQERMWVANWMLHLPWLKEKEVIFESELSIWEMRALVWKPRNYNAVKLHLGVTVLKKASEQKKLNSFQHSQQTETDSDF